MNVYYWSPEMAGGYPPSEEQLAQFPLFYRTRYRDAGAEEVRMHAAGSAILLAMHLHVTSDDQLIRGNHGALSLKNDPRHICLSHSGGVTALAVSDDPVGLDMERMNRTAVNSEATIKRFFPPSLQAQMKAASLETRIETFFACWTKLEAAVKLDGRGLTIPREEFEEVLSRYNIVTQRHGDLMVSIATEK